MSVVRLFNPGLVGHFPKERRRRFWIEPTQMVKVGPESFMWLYVDRDVDEPENYTIRAHVQRMPVSAIDKREDVYKLLPSTWIDLTAHCGVMALPRAVDTELTGRASRILLEFVTLDDRVDWVVPA